MIFLVTAENELATTYIIGRVGNGDYGVALAYCTVLIVLMSLAVALIQWLVGERALGRRAGAPASAGTATERTRERRRRRHRIPRRHASATATRGAPLAVAASASRCAPAR